MSKICAKCEKPVYQTEELLCMDRSWHKLCFKCWECGTSLNMKNYKAYDKKPYCSAHYPQQRPTTVADTPELKHMTQASKLSSQAKYHEEFVKNKNNNQHNTRLRYAVTPSNQDNKRVPGGVASAVISQSQDSSVNTDLKAL